VNRRVDLLNPDYDGVIVDYRRFVLDVLARPDPGYRLYRTAFPSWDNAPRRPDHALTFINSTPEIYEIWLREIVARTIEERPPAERLVFINAWNEWAECAHLEPDRRYGHQFLEATRRALIGSTVGGLPFARFTGRVSGHP
jgi:hypothetical protein